MNTCTTNTNYGCVHTSRQMIPRATVAAFLLLAGFICTALQCGFIDQLEVKKPITITAHPDTELRTFWFDPLCDNTTMQEQVDNIVNCPMGYRAFVEGCSSTMTGRNTKLTPYTMLAATFTFLNIFIIYYIRVKDNVMAIGSFIGQALLFMFTLIYWLVYRSYETIEQCSPGPNTLWKKWGELGELGELGVDALVRGCTWQIPDYTNFLWVANEVRSSCRNVELDDSDPYAPQLLVHAIASPLVQQTVNATLSTLRIVAIVHGCLLILSFIESLRALRVLRISRAQSYETVLPIVSPVPQPGPVSLPSLSLESIVTHENNKDKEPIQQSSRDSILAQEVCGDQSPLRLA